MMIIVKIIFTFTKMFRIIRYVERLELTNDWWERLPGRLLGHDHDYRGIVCCDCDHKHHYDYIRDHCG